MKRRYVGLIVGEAIIIMLLLIGGAVLVLRLGRSGSLLSLPSVPTYESVFSTTTSLSAVSTSRATITLPAALSIPTQTPVPLFILNGTPIFPTAPQNNPARVPSLTSTPLSAFVVTSTPTPGVPGLGQPCRNILYPVAPGAQWQYQATALGRTDIFNMSVLSVNNSQGTVQVNDQTSGSTKQVQVQCDGDVIRSFPFVSADALFGNFINSSLTASYISGVLAPNEAAFLNSNWALSWTSQYLVTGSTVVTSNGRQFNVTMNNSPITLTCQTLGAGDAAFENVTIAAGTFRALKVVCTEQGQVTANVNGFSVSGLAESRSNQWFVLNMGLVKMQVESARVNVFGIPFSMLMDNSIELKGFTPAP